MKESRKREVIVKNVVFLKHGKPQQPFVGVEVFPRQVIMCEGQNRHGIDSSTSTSSTSNEFVVNPKDEDFCHKKGIRLRYEWSIAKSCVFHHHEQSEMTCLICGLGFCSTKCFYNRQHFHRLHIEMQKHDVNWDMFYINDEREAIRSKKCLYIPKIPDVGKQLILQITPFNLQNEPIGESFKSKTNRVFNFPKVEFNDRVFENIINFEDGDFSRGNVNNQDDENIKFTVLNYNVLADIYATREFFPTTEECYLDWNYRKMSLLREILSYDSDVICLQEVQSNHFKDFFYPNLKRNGYEGTFKKKTKSIYTGGGVYTIDGCAIFYKKSKFSFIRKYEIEFRDLALKEMNMKEKGGEEDARYIKRLIRDNISLILILKINRNNNMRNRGQKDQFLTPSTPRGSPIICIGNVHIMANAMCKDVKLWQIHSYLKELKEITNQFKGSNTDIPIVLAGDFNSVPESAAYSLISNGYVSKEHVESIENFNRSILNHLFRKSKSIDHELNLTSSYSRSKLGEPKYTNKAYSFSGTLDYIFYSTDHIELTKILTVPNLKDVLLPNRRRSSDHLPLKSEFMIMKKKKKKSNLSNSSSESSVLRLNRLNNRLNDHPLPQIPIIQDRNRYLQRGYYEDHQFDQNNDFY